MDGPQTNKQQKNMRKENPGKQLHSGKGTRAIEARQELAAQRATKSQPAYQKTKP